MNLQLNKEEQDILGDDILKQESQNDNVKMFLQRLRRERFNQRIKLLCLPQLGESLTQNFYHRQKKINKQKHQLDLSKILLNSRMVGYVDKFGDKIYIKKK